MTLDLRSLELFVRVATLGAMARAGAEFQLSPTATTQRIQALEGAVGANLLTRATRSVSLTPDGEIFLEHARKVLDSVEGAMSAVSHAERGVSGELRVTASASFGRCQIVPHVGEFLQRYPDVRLRLDLSDTIVDIVDQGFDLAIRLGALSSSALLARKLAPLPRMLVAAPQYLERFGTPVRASDLRNHNCIALGETRAWSLRDRQGALHDVRVSGAFATNFGEAVTEVVLDGVGIGLKSACDIGAHLKAGRLVEVLGDHTIEPHWSVWAVRPQKAVVPARVQAFVGFLDEKLRAAGLGA